MKAEISSRFTFFASELGSMKPKVYISKEIVVTAYHGNLFWGPHQFESLQRGTSRLFASFCFPSLLFHWVPNPSNNWATLELWRSSASLTNLGPEVENFTGKNAWWCLSYPALPQWLRKCHPHQIWQLAWEKWNICSSVREAWNGGHADGMAARSRSKVKSFNSWKTKITAQFRLQTSRPHQPPSFHFGSSSQHQTFQSPTEMHWALGLRIHSKKGPAYEECVKKRNGAWRKQNTEFYSIWIWRY